MILTIFLILQIKYYLNLFNKIGKFPLNSFGENVVGGNVRAPKYLVINFHIYLNNQLYIILYYIILYYCYNAIFLT